MKKLVLGLAVCSLIFMSGCSLKEKVDKSTPIIKVNGNVITENMYNELMEQNYSGLPKDKKKPEIEDTKSKFIKLVQKSRAINDLIVIELIKSEADKRQIVVKDEEVDNAISSITQSMGGEEKLKESLKQNNISDEAFRKTIKFDILRNKLVQNLIGSNKISEADVKKFYEENKNDKFKHGDEVRASHILISASESDIRSKIKDENPKITESEADKLVEKQISEARRKAQKLYLELQAKPEKFAEYAKNYSEDPSSAAKGGDLGFFAQGEMVPEFSKAAFATKPGKMSELVKTEFGYHIIKVTDRKTAGVTPFDEIKPRIAMYLENKQKMDALQKLLEHAKQTATIEFVSPEFDPKNIRTEYKTLIDEMRAVTAAESGMPQADKVDEKEQQAEPQKL